MSDQVNYGEVCDFFLRAAPSLLLVVAVNGLGTIRFFVRDPIIGTGLHPVLLTRIGNDGRRQRQWLDRRRSGAGPVPLRAGRIGCEEARPRDFMRSTSTTTGSVLYGVTDEQGFFDLYKMGFTVRPLRGRFRNLSVRRAAHIERA